MKLVQTNCGEFDSNLMHTSGEKVSVVEFINF